MTDARSLVSSLPRGLAADALTAGSRGYRSAQHTYTYRGAPAVILRPADASQVAEGLTWVRGVDVPFAVRSGGHGISGRSTNDGGVVIDLARMSAIDVESPSVTVGSGARWWQVAHALAPAGLAITSGDSGDVGVGGLATVGGIGLLGRRDGLTIDRVTGAEVVTADGRVVWTDASNEPELFWGIRGAGANLGVVTSFRFAAASLGTIAHAQVMYEWPSLATALPQWAAVMQAAPRDVTMFLYLSGNGRGARAFGQAIVASDDEATIRARLQPFAHVPGAAGLGVHLTTYADALPGGMGPQTGAAEGLVRSALVTTLDRSVAEGLQGAFAAGADMIQIRAVGGAINDMPADHTAYAHRHQNFALMASGPTAASAALNAAWRPIIERTDGLYLNFDNSGDSELVTLAYPPATLGRLRKLKAVWDPDNVFHGNFGVGSA